MFFSIKTPSTLFRPSGAVRAKRFKSDGELVHGTRKLVGFFLMEKFYQSSSKIREKATSARELWISLYSPLKMEIFGERSSLFRRFSL